MYEQAFNNIDNALWKDAGCSNELDYVEQTSWVLFLKYLEDFEEDKIAEAELTDKKYQPIIAPEFRWSTWAAPKLENGNIDHNSMTGDDLTDFVNFKLFPYLREFRKTARSSDTIEYKIGEIFSEIKNKIQSGYILRDIISHVDELHFGTKVENYELSQLYELKIKRMGNAGRNGGEYYTPRPLIKAIVKVVNPEISDTIYDGACGSCGFLIEPYDFLNTPEISSAEYEKLQTETFYGKEKKSLAYVIGIMNMILHGIEAPNIIHTNTLTENIMDFQEKDKYSVVLSNPPFGGKERKEVQHNFPIQTSETASLFLQHFMRILKVNGKAGIVIKNTFLSNADNATTSLRKELLETCNLHTVLDLPGGVFVGAGVKTVVLFFTKGKPTEKIWYYKLNLERNLGKTDPLNEDDLAEFIELQKTKAESENSWTVDIKNIDKKTFDLSVKNPNAPEEEPLRPPEEILDEIEALDKECAEILENVRKLL